MAKPKIDLHERVTNRILEELENGCAPWIKPWSRDKSAPVTLPTNLDSGKEYRGINVFLLWSACIARDWSDWRFMTYKQAKKLGGQVRKGETGEHVCFFSKMTKEVETDSGNTEEKTFGFWKSYTVFNIDQVDGLPEKYTVRPETPAKPVETLSEEFSAFICETGATLKHGGNEAYYKPSTDHIQMPHVAQFRGLENYQATLLHELTHWTGHGTRCKRDLSNRFGSKGYAFEELVAELGAALLCAELGVVGDIRHAAYIQSWIRLLKDDKRAFMQAASKAQNAVDWLRAKALADNIPQAA